MKLTPFSSSSWSKYWTQLRHYRIAVFIFTIGLLLTAGAFYFYQQQDLVRTQSEFNHLADLRLFLIKDILSETVQTMESIKAFYEASEKISQHSFHIFVSNLLNQYSSNLAIGWLSSDTSDVSLIGLNFISHHPEKSSPISHFFPLTYLETSHAHKHVDIDIADYPTFLKELKESEEQTILTVSDSIHYFQGEKKQGFFLFAPVFKTSHASQKKRIGTIIGIASFDDVIDRMRSHFEQREANISIYDLTRGSHHLIYWNAANLATPPQDTQNQKQWERDQIFRIGNRVWELQATPKGDFTSSHQNWLWPHWEVPIIGLLISLLMSSYFLILANRRMLVEQEVQDRTNELANINNILQQEIHERQRIEEEFMDKQNYLQKRHEALKYLTKLTTSELRSSIQEVILRTAVVMQVNRVGIWFYETQDGIPTLFCYGLYILSNNSFSNHLKLDSFHFPHYFEALSQSSHLILPSAENAELNQELASYLATFKINSKLDIPIVFEGKLLGVLTCEETRGYRNWVLEDRHFGHTIADIVAIMIEQSARRKAEQAFQESEERLRFITQRSIDGIISVNNSDQVISWNYGAQQMFGYQEEEIIGKSLRNVLPHDDFIFQKEISIKPIELKGRHRDGHLFPVEISQTRWETEEISFNTIIIRDITERKEHEKRLIKAIRDANAANAAKSEFLATMSHELRTPLNAIIGFNQCLLIGMDGPITLSQKESLKKIEKSSLHLLNLINDILDWSKIEAKKMEIDVAPQNIVEVIISCIEEMKPLAQQKNLNIDLSVDSAFVLVEIDRMRIRQVLLNLLSNAVKFTEEGFIKMVLINEPDLVRIQVIDTGIGLSAEEIEKIFHPFSQADSSITRKYGGSGLGLVISKNIINLHKGAITVESQKGRGSIFSIILPKVQ